MTTSTPGPVGPETFRLDGQVALITGASRNIGAAVSRAFAAAGADLLLVARDRHRLSTFADSVRAESGRRVEHLAIDIRNPEAASTVSAYADRVLPPVSVLINNAFSAGVRGPILDAQADVWTDVLEANLLAPFRLCQEFGRRMLAGDGGSIINVVSGSGLLPTRHNGPYGTSKAALWMLTRYLAVEAAPLVRVNALCPGLVSESGQPRSEAARDIIADVPMGRVARPEEVAGAAVYLASPAASYTTGELLVVNGGRPW